MNHRDVEQLSSYLDGGLSPSDSARLEFRLASDPALASALDALRESRSLLRRMPHRRAPRNFLLTPKMVGQKPPLPRSYPIFKFATAFAAFLFFISFVTAKTSQLAASAPAPFAGGMGGGADASVTEPPMLEMAPAATESPVEGSVTQTPEPLSTKMAVAPPTATSESTEDANRVLEETSQKGAGESESAPPFLSNLQIALVVITLLGASSLLLIQRLAARKWRNPPS